MGLHDTVANPYHNLASKLMLSAIFRKSPTYTQYQAAQCFSRQLAFLEVHPAQTCGIARTRSTTCLRSGCCQRRLSARLEDFRIFQDTKRRSRYRAAILDTCPA